MSDQEENVQAFEQESLDNPLRVLVVVNGESKEDGEMQERSLDSISHMEDVNAFFDKFDEEVAIPNEGHIKYEVGSDGLVVVVVDSEGTQEVVLKFIDKYQVDGAEESEDETSRKKKKPSH